MDKQNMAQLYSGIGFSHKKEAKRWTCYRMDEPQKPDTEWEKPDTEGHVSYESIHMKYSK